MPQLGASDFLKVWSADHLHHSKAGVPVKYKLEGPVSISCDSESLVGVLALLTNTLLCVKV